MKRFLTSRAAIVALYLLVVLGAGAGLWRYGYGQALEALAKQGQADLALASDRVAGQLQRYRELAVLMAEHPEVDALVSGTEPVAARKLFQTVADKTSALDVMYMDIDGFVRAAAREGELHNLAKLPFARRAMQGALGAGIQMTSPLAERSYYFAAPHFGPSGVVRGAVVVAVDVARIEWDWTGSNPAVFFTDRGGLVQISNRSELVGWVRRDDRSGLDPPKGPLQPFAERRVGELELWDLDWGPYLPNQALHIERDMPIYGLRSEALIDTRPALRIAGLQASAFVALCLAFGALLYLVTERRRTLAEANARLEARVVARTQALSETNAALRREINERQEAEAALRQAQADLVQAGKLSALGQMSAGISHELNQPLMAIGSFAENAQAFMERDKPAQARENLGRISDLAERMGRIIRNLRAFARQESAPVSRVDLVEVLAVAVDLTQAKLRDADVTLQFDAPLTPVWAKGGEVRLSQVFVNLISNAADAMAGRPERRLTISIEDGAQLAVRVQDTGPGIQLPDKVFEPFYSTKTDEDQDGMGLGLSISYGIVQSFGGDIRGTNAANGGAIFTVDLERWAEEAAA